MAVDTFAKRKSIIDLARPGPAIPIPDTSGVIASERAHFLGLYSGLTLEGPPDADTSVAVVTTWRELTVATYAERSAATYRERTATTWKERR